MPEEKNNINRRNFLKTVAAAGAGSAFLPGKLLAEQKDPNVADAKIVDPNALKKPKKPPIPMRKFGKFKYKVPIYSLGLMFNVLDKMIVLRKSIQLGVTFWDTANNYAGGNSEIAVGKFFTQNPKLRKKIILTTKSSGARSTDNVEQKLQLSLKRMNTDYIDIYYGVHAIRRPGQLTDDLRKWAEDAKKRKLIKFFGFTTHANTDCLLAAAKTDWIDVIMTNYNFRLMQKPEMQDAIQACYEKGIALIAMKTLAHKVENDKDKELIEYFTKKGYTEAQAKIKAVLQDKRFCTACVGIGSGNIEHLILDVDAVKDKNKLSKKDLAFLADYAQKTCDGYCPGCSQICSKAVPDMPYIAEIMRYLMYYNSYGQQKEARELFAKIPGTVRNKLLSIDYSLAEARCPQHLPIGKLVAEAVSKLA